MKKLVALTLALAACGPTLRYRHLRPDYNVTDREHTKRLLIVTAPFPDGNQKAAELWNLLAKRLIHLKKHFIVKDTRAAADAFDVRGKCGEGVEGVLWLQPMMTKKDDGYEVTAIGTYLRCKDGQQIWTARVDSFGHSKEEGLKQTISDYARDVGAEAEPYVAPSEHALKTLIDALPDVDLTESEKDEWIETSE